MENTNRYERWWGTALIVLGVALLAVVFVTAFAIVGDPGGYFDDWVPADGPAGPEASFDWTSSDLNVEFADTSSLGDAADIERWAWDFGDGTEATEPTPSHRFGEEGEYTVTLDVVDANGASSQAEATVGLEMGAVSSGSGAIGLNDMADKLVATVERSSKAAGVVLLVIGLFLVLTLIGGRVTRQGVRVLRPVPERISVRLRPRHLELEMRERAAAVSEEPQLPSRPREADPTEAREERIPSGV